MAKRNDPCPCGSKKKYKYCCLTKDMEAANLRKTVLSKEEEAAWEQTRHKVPTWLIFSVATVIFAGLGALIYFLGYSRAAGAVFGCGLLVSVMFAIFRSAPPSRKTPGDGGNINFGSGT